MIPTIHMNGDSRETIVKALEAASVALDAAMDALAGTAPNGRNFYPQGPAATGAASREFEARMRKLAEVKEEVDAIWCAIPMKEV